MSFLCRFVLYNGGAVEATSWRRIASKGTCHIDRVLKRRYRGNLPDVWQLVDRLDWYLKAGIVSRVDQACMPTVILRSDYGVRVLRWLPSLE